MNEKDEIFKESLKEFLKKEKLRKKEIVEEAFTIYKPGSFGSYANRLFRNQAQKLIKAYPSFFNKMFEDYQKVGIPYLAETYVSVMLFVTVLSFPAAIILFPMLNIVFKLPWPLIIVLIILTPIIAFIFSYYYFSSLISDW